MAPQDNLATQPDASAVTEPRRIDDADTYAEPRSWAFSETDDGRTVEDVVADLAASGWQADDARRETHHGRGADRSAGADVNVRAKFAESGLIGGLMLWITRLFRNHHRKKQ